MRLTFLRSIAFAAIALSAAAPIAAQDFSEGSQAQSWGLLGEEQARFSGKVVDVLCELSGDCADNCGGGTRQLGIVRSADNVLVLALKNGQPLFNGAVQDLMPYCGEAVEVDGLLIGDETARGAKFYQVQLIRREGEADWNKTVLWTKAWNENHPDLAKQDGQWFRKDPLVNKHIEAEGYLGLGQQADETFIKDNY